MHWIELQCNVMSFKFVCDRDKLRDGASRVRKGTPGSLPLGLLTPTVPWVQLHWTFTGLQMGLT